MNKTDENVKEVLFDPGFAPIAIASLGQVGYNYYVFEAIGNLKLKRLTFLQTSKKLEFHLKNNVSFYLGCLLWASYIKQFENAKLSGNELENEKCDEKEYVSEIDFLIDFIENKYPRDYIYFLNKKFEPDLRYVPILKAYREFLVENNGFYKVSTTAQIKLPKSLKTLDKKQLDNINLKIQTAIKNKNLDELLELYDILF